MTRNYVRRFSLNLNSPQQVEPLPYWWHTTILILLCLLFYNLIL